MINRFAHQIRICEEDKTRTTVDDLVYGGLLNVRHIAQDGEHENPSEKAGQCVDNTGDNCIPEKNKK